jgi:hypothetical protein
VFDVSKRTLLCLLSTVDLTALYGTRGTLYFPKIETSLLVKYFMHSMTTTIKLEIHHLSENSR